MNDPIILRPAVRNALRAAHGKALDETRLKIAMERLIGGEKISVPEFREALEWNHERNFIEFTKNEELEVLEWKLTAKGRKKESAA